MNADVRELPAEVMQDAALRFCVGTQPYRSRSAVEVEADGQFGQYWKTLSLEQRAAVVASQNTAVASVVNGLPDIAAQNVGRQYAQLAADTFAAALRELLVVDNDALTEQQLAGNMRILTHEERMAYLVDCMHGHLVRRLPEWFSG